MESKKYHKFKDKELLRYYAELIEEMRNRKLIRSNNNPTSDYAEKIAADKLGLKLCSKSTKGYDAIDNKTGDKVQIKGRRLTRHNKSRQLGVLRNLEEKLFDFLIVILFGEFFIVKEAYKVPYHVVYKIAQSAGKWSNHQNGYIIYATSELISNPKTLNLTPKFG